MAHVPYETAISVLSAGASPMAATAASALVTVISNGVPSIGQPVGLTSMAVQMFTANGVPVITDSNTGQPVSMSPPAARGDTLIIWATGLGYTSFDPPTGNPAPGTTTNLAAQYAGLAPGFVGLYQINVQILANAQTGTAVLQIVPPGFTAAAPYVIAIR